MKNRSPWIYVLAFTAIWHFSRGAYGDALVFGAGTALLEFDHRGIHKLLPARVAISKSVLTILVLISWVTLTISVRYGLIDMVTLYVLGGLAFISAWHPDYGKRNTHNVSSRRAAMYWSVLALIVCSIELISYIFASMTKDDFLYPTLTVLLDPSLDHLVGRGIFTAVWLAIGLRLIRPRLTENKS